MNHFTAVAWSEFAGTLLAFGTLHVGLKAWGWFVEHRRSRAVSRPGC